MNKRKIPYGISDYKVINDENYLYVDKTRFIEELEHINTKYPVFLRPRRFGKSLFVSTLQYYYDKKYADEFDALFKDTYIGKHKTAWANSYYVMRFDFSKLDTESEETLKKSFYRTVQVSLEVFRTYYGLDVPVKENNDYNSADLLHAFLSEVNQIIGRKLYIMIDEYDHFANAVLNNRRVFTKITSKEGFVRSFYEVFKSHTSGSCIDRIFITGVTSLTLDSLTSGFNIAKNISMVPYLNEMVGFTKEETFGLLEDAGVENKEEVIQLMVNNYNGYLFHQEIEDQSKRVFNSNMVLYFLDEYQIRGRVPDKLTDPNIKSDYHKLTSMFNLFEKEEERQRILEDIMSDKGIGTDIITNFNFSAPFKEEDFLSLLFYLGLLTIKEKGKAFEVILQTPNAAIRDVYYQYYANYLNLTTREKRTAIADIAFNNDFTELNRLVGDILKLHSNDDYRGFDEARLKSVFLSCFSDQNLFLVKSEYASEGRKADIALFDQYGRRNDIKYNYLIELKYIKKSQAERNTIESVRDNAARQMQEYLNLREFKDNPRIKGLIYVVAKDKIIYFEEVKR